MFVSKFSLKTFSLSEVLAMSVQYGITSAAIFLSFGGSATENGVSYDKSNMQLIIQSIINAT